MSISTLRKMFGNMLGQSHDGKRDIYSTFGYPNTISFYDFYNLYKRYGVAKRIVESISKSCWRDGVVIEEKNLKNTFANFTKYIEKADILNRIGRFSLLFVGVPDGLNPSQPIGRINQNQLEDIYFQAFSEDGIKISKFDTDILSKRFGLPLEYQLTVSSIDKELNSVQNTKLIHWSRVIHVAEGALDSELDGVPALEGVYNDLLDLRKVTGSSAEAFFRNTRDKLHFDVRDGYSDAIQDSDLADKTEAFTNEWLNVIRTNGIDVKSINTNIHSPLDTAKVILWSISGATSIPLRVLTGEGSGQLAGNNDYDSYNQLIQDRQKTFCMDLVKRFCGIMQECGAFEIDVNLISFPKIEALSETEKADISQKKADTLVKLSQAFNDVTSGIAGYIDIDNTLQELGFKGV